MARRVKSNSVVAYGQYTPIATSQYFGSQHDGREWRQRANQVGSLLRDHHRGGAGVGLVIAANHVQRLGKAKIAERRQRPHVARRLPQTQLIMEITGVNKFDDPKNWRIYDVSTIQRPSANSDLQYDEMVCAAAVRRIQ